jgi:hypothetical protein
VVAVTPDAPDVLSPAGGRAGAFGDKASAQRLAKQHDIHSPIRPAITSQTSQHYAEALRFRVITCAPALASSGRGV